MSVSKDTMLVKGDIITAYGLISDIKICFVESIDGKKSDTIVINRSNEIQLINNYGENALVEVYVEEVPKELDGIKIKDAGLNDRYKITVGIIKRGDEYLYVSKDTIIQKGDLVTFFGPYKNIKMLFGSVEKEKK